MSKLLKRLNDNQNKVADTNGIMKLQAWDYGVAQDLTNKQITATVANASGFLFDIDLVSNGTEIDLDFKDSQLQKLTPDTYFLEIKVTEADGDVSVFPTEGYATFTINKNLHATEGALVPQITFDTVLADVKTAMDKTVADYVKTIAKGDKGDTGPAGKDGKDAEIPIVGGRNLYLGSKVIEEKYGTNDDVAVTIEPFDSTTNMWHIVATQGAGETKGIYFYDYVNGKMPNNSDWSYSVDIKGRGKPVLLGIEYGEKNPIEGTIGSTWSRISQTGFMYETDHKTLVMYFDTTDSPLDVYIKLPKLESGNVATDWTPAPEDVDNRYVQKSGNTITSGLKGGQINLGDSGDLNELTDTGKYYQTFTWKTKNWSNRPSNAPNLAFSVDVIGQANQALTTQLYYVHTTSRMWIRTMWLDGTMKASQWVELANNANVVHNTGDENITGDKTFTDSMVVNNTLEANTLYKRVASTGAIPIIEMDDTILNRKQSIGHYYSAFTYGSGVTLGAGGLTIVGGGESAKGLGDAINDGLADTSASGLPISDHGNEHTIIASDGYIYFMPGQQAGYPTLAPAFRLSSSGYLDKYTGSGWTPLITPTSTLLAQDSQVVHNTGNETVAGNKTFSGNTTMGGTLMTDSGWKNMSLASGVKASVARYRLLNGVVYIQVLDVIADVGKVFATLPAGYRPPHWIWESWFAANKSGNFLIGDKGDVSRASSTASGADSGTKASFEVSYPID